MALPTIKIACSNGHFQESLQNHGDKGTWTSNDGTSPTKLIDAGANWVVDEWIGYYVVFDTGGTPTPIIITDNDQTSITVAGDYSAQVGKDYRIAGGITGTVTANASASTSIALTAVKDRYGTAHNPIANEFAKMVFVPDKLDGTAYNITANIAGTAATTLTIDTSIAVTATSCEVGRGASATLYPEEVNISGEINEPKNMSATIVYNVAGGFDDDDSITNPLQLGSLVRVTETTGNKTLFDGFVYETPVEIDAETRTMSITAMDRTAILDHTVIPVTTDDPSSYSFTKGTPVVESGITGASSNNNYLQTKGYQDHTYVPRPLAISSYASSTANPYNANTSDGTWAAVQATANSGKNDDSSTNGKVLRFSTGGFLTGTPGTDCVEAGCVVIKLDSTAANMRVTYVDEVNTDTKLTTTDDVTWALNDYFLILSKNWQVGEGIESDVSYVDRSGTDGFKIDNCLREELAATTDNVEKPSTDPTKTKMYVGRNSTFSSRDAHYPYNGRAWILILGSTKAEIAQYSGYIPDYQKDKWFLRAYNEVPNTARNTRNDLTGEWNTGSGFSDVGSTTWAADTPVLEIYPNRFGVTEPVVYKDTVRYKEDVGAVASEGIIQFAQGDTNRNNMKKIRVHQHSYDGDARNNSPGPNKGTDETAIDLTDIVQVATTGLTNTSATPQQIISTSKLMGGAGLVFNTDDSLNTGIYINKFDYKAFGDSKTSIHPKDVINKICDDSSLLYDLRYDDESEKIIFKPLSQKSTADITIAAGGITSLSREKDVSDVFSAMLCQISTPRQNYFDPSRILQYGCNFNASGVPKSNAIPSDFSSGGYSSGSSPPDFFWGRTYLEGLGPDLVDYTKSKGTYDRKIVQSFWRKDEWIDRGTTDGGSARYSRKIMGKIGNPVPARADNGNYLPIITLWFKNNATLKTLDNFTFRLVKATEHTKPWKIRIEVSDDVDLSDPLGTGTWKPFNDAARDFGNSSRAFGLKVDLAKYGPCKVKNVKAIRVLGIDAPNAIPGQWSEGRELTRLKSDYNRGYQTWGATTTNDSTPNTSLAEDFNYSEKSPGNDDMNRSRPMFNRNRQDTSGIYSTGGWEGRFCNGKQMKAGFKEAINSTGTDGGSYAGYAQGSFCLADFDVKGEGVYAMYVRVTKDQSSEGSPERNTYSPSYKKIAGLGYKVNPIPLENFSDAEALTIGQQFLDDKLRRFQARDYSLDGKSPFLNSNNIPFLGQTITIADDSNFTGILTSYEFTMNSEGARFDFRLEDYDRNKTAQYIQAK